MQNYKYYAFISYARKDSTKQAKYIQKELEHYRYPMAGIAEFRMPNDKKYLRKIFLDLNELENSVKTFQEELLHKIENSKYLIVLCSLESAKSKWVSEEIEYFLKTHNNDYSFIVPVLINGKVPDNIPKILQRQDILNRNLPTFVEFDGDEKNEAKERGLSQLIAYLLGLQRDKVSNRFQVEKRKQQLKLIKFFAVLLVMFICLTAWALFERKRAIENEKIAIKQREEQSYVYKFYERMLGERASQRRNISVLDLLVSRYGKVFENDNPYIKIQLALSFAKILSWHTPDLANKMMDETFELIQKLPPDIKKQKLADYYKCKGDICSITTSEQHETALNFYKTALQYQFDNPENYIDVYFVMSNIYEGINDFSNSEKCLLEYIKLSNNLSSTFVKTFNFSKGYEKLTRTYIYLKNYQKALLSNTKELEINPYLNSQVKDAELKYLTKQYTKAIQQVEKYNKLNIKDYYSEKFKYNTRCNIIQLLCNLKINPKDIKGTEKLNFNENKIIHQAIDQILNDESMSYDNKNDNIKYYCNLELYKFLLLQDIDIHHYEMRYDHYSYPIRKIAAYTILKNYQRATEIGDNPDVIKAIENPILKLKLFALLKYDYKMLYKETGDSQYQAKEKQYYNDFMNLYPKVQEEIKNAKYTPAQKAVLLDEIKTKIVAYINE